MQGLHILGASRTLPFHSIGGMQAIAWDVFRVLAGRGHQVTVLTTAIPGRDQAFDADGVRVEPITSAAPERYSSAWWRDSDLRAVRIHEAHPVDAVLSISSAAAEMRGLRRAAPHAKFIFQAHGTSWGEAQSKWRSGEPGQWLKSISNLYGVFKDARIYRRFDHIALCGDVLERQFSAAPMPWVAGRVARSVIRNGIDTRVFRPDAQAGARVRTLLGIKPHTPLIVFAARLHPQKGARQLLTAFKKLAAKDPEPHLLIIGDGPEMRALCAMAWEGPFAPRIHTVGAVSREHMPAYLAAGQVFAFPTLRQEGLPMNVLEALACGMPAVVSESMRPAFLPSLPLRFCDPKRTDDLAAALAAALAANPPTAPSASLLPSEYSLDACAQAYSSLLSTRK